MQGGDIGQISENGREWTGGTYIDREYKVSRESYLNILVPTEEY